MSNPFFRRLITTPSLQFLLDMISTAKNEIIIVSPWIKHKMLQKVIGTTNPNKNINWKVLTRGNHNDFCEELSDIDAFRLMIENNSFDLRANGRLHAKVYIVDGALSLVTSANLTENGMRLNPEVGVASEDPSEISELTKEISKWFDEAIPLDQLWLNEEQEKLSRFEKEKPPAPPFDPTNYHHLDEDDKKNAGGKYRELPLPEVWKPLLDALKETAIPSHHDYLMVDDLIPAFIDFFKYVRKIRNGKRHEQHLMKWLVQKQTIEAIAKDEKITKQRISQKIGKPGTDSGEIWKSEDGEKFIRQLSSFLNSAIGKTELRVSDVLSSEQLQPLGLSHYDLYQFVCGMIENKFIVGSCHTEITQTNQFLIYNKEIYSVLKELDVIFRADYQRFMDFEKFCQLGELEKVNDLWFYNGFGLFKNLYVTKNGKIGCRRWGMEKLIEAIAWELADKLDFYYWHFSEMREALKYLSPTKFENTSVRYVDSRLSTSKEKFHFAGSKGYWQLTDLGDGYHTNKDAIISIFHRAADTSLYYKEVIKELGEMGRRINEGSIYALLDRDEAFENLDQGKFRLMEKVD